MDVNSSETLPAIKHDGAKLGKGANVKSTSPKATITDDPPRLVSSQASTAVEKPSSPRGSNEISRQQSSLSSAPKSKRPRLIGPAKPPPSSAESNEEKELSKRDNVGQVHTAYSVQNMKHYNFN